MRKTYLIMCFAVILLLVACGKEEDDDVIGNDGTQINTDSINAPGGEENNEEPDSNIGKEKSDTLIIVINWDKIVIDDIEYSNIEEMKDQIIKSGCKKIDLQHTDANKETLDEVEEMLKDIEKTLEIDINYN